MRFVELVPALRPALAAQRLTPHARDVRRGVGVGVQAGGARRARGGAARGGGAGGLHGSPRSWRSSTPTPPSTSTHRSTTAEETIVEAASQDIICFKQVAGSIPSQAGVRARARRRHRPAERGGRGGGGGCMDQAAPAAAGQAAPGGAGQGPELDRGCQCRGAGGAGDRCDQGGALAAAIRMRVF